MKRAFTLIELLIVIAIIGSLSALFLPNYMAARERARDSQRKFDLRQIQKALELYKQDQPNSSFIASVVCGTPASTCFPNSGLRWINAVNNVYMNLVPKDPNRTSNDGKYFYSLGADLITYTLCACLENKADPDGVAGDCEAVNYTCSSGKKYVVNQP